MTRSRVLVLKILEGAAEPMSAAGVYALVDGACDQATVYRSLAYLEGAGLAESFVMHCDAHGTERYYSSEKLGHRHWFHCSSCHRFVDIGACRLGPLVGELEAERGLRIERHALYLSGLCADCAGRAGGSQGMAGAGGHDHACGGTSG